MFASRGRRSPWNRKGRRPQECTTEVIEETEVRNDDSTTEDTEVTENGECPERTAEDAMVAETFPERVLLCDLCDLSGENVLAFSVTSVTSVVKMS